MKKIINLIAVLFLVTSMTGCLKDTPANDFSTISPIIELPYHGLEGLTNDAVITAGKTDPIIIPIVVNLASKDVLSKDLTAKLAVDDNLRTKYNALGGNQFEPLPDSTYSFTATDVLIKAGTRLDTLYLTVYPDKVDPTINYMLPIKIAEANGATISGNFGVMYVNMIGNPLAGNYKWDFIRYNNQDGSGTPVTTWTGQPTLFSPVDPTSIKVPTGYYTQPNYLITFTNNNGVLSNFSAVIAPDEIQAAFTDNGVTVVTGPTIEVNSNYTKFTLKYVVFNGSAYRNITDIFYK